jgi:hypothetical protein
MYRRLLLAAVIAAPLCACTSEPTPPPVQTMPAFTVPTTTPATPPGKVELVKQEWRDLPTPMNGGKTTREAACTVTITNTSQETKKVIWADIIFDSEDGKEKLGEAPAGANQLQPGQSETTTVSLWQIQPTNRPFKCRVTNIH